MRTYKDQRISKATIDWEAPKEELTSWQAQWNDFIDAIRNDKPINQAKRAALSNLADIMGRAAIHMGKVVTWDEAMASEFQFCPNIDELTYDAAPPIKADAAGRYPVPVPGDMGGDIRSKLSSAAGRRRKTVGPLSRATARKYRCGNAFGQDRQRAAAPPPSQCQLAQLRRSLRHRCDKHGRPRRIRGWSFVVRPRRPHSARFPSSFGRTNQIGTRGPTGADSLPCQSSAHDEPPFSWSAMLVTRVRSPPRLQNPISKACAESKRDPRFHRSPIAPGLRQAARHCSETLQPPPPALTIESHRRHRNRRPAVARSRRIKSGSGVPSYEAHKARRGPFASGTRDGEGGRDLPSGFTTAALT